MDRQAWIAISVCVLGLIGWYAYTATHLPPPQRAPVAAAPASTTPADSSPIAAPSPSVSEAPLSQSSPSPVPTESAPAFAEKTETLSNGDVELHLTNRGGAIGDVVLLNQTLDN